MELNKKPKIIGGYQNTKLNGEDFVITPYLFSVFVKAKIVKVYGIGICWGYHSVYIGIGFNIPKGYAGFNKLNNNKPTN